MFDRQAFLGRLQMRVASAAPPDVATQIGCFGLDLRIHLAGALARHRDLDAGLTLEGGDHEAAPLLLDAAVEYERALCFSRKREKTHETERSEQCKTASDGRHWIVLPAWC